ncbi:MAG: hypothetical protein V3V96_14295 [Acidiferrobacterales bacterium]
MPTDLTVIEAEAEVVTAPPPLDIYTLWIWNARLGRWLLNEERLSLSSAQHAARAFVAAGGHARIVHIVEKVFDGD